MFTGLVEEVGEVQEIRPIPDGLEFQILCSIVLKNTQIGDSISTSGVCLTVTDFDHTSFKCTAVAETLRKTSLGDLKAGDKVNLERSLTLEKRIGGHLVQGHIDGIATASDLKIEGDSHFWTFSTGAELSRYMVPKGSITVDGVSLTIVDCDHTSFRVALIPQTLKETTLQYLAVGSRVNIEVDIIGKYVHHFLIGNNEFIPNVVRNIIR